MAVLDRLHQHILFPGGSGYGIGPRAKSPASHIDRIGSRIDRGLRREKGARRCEKLRAEAHPALPSFSESRASFLSASSSFRFASSSFIRVLMRSCFAA